MKDLHGELAIYAASKFAKMLAPRLAELEASVVEQRRDASFTVTCQFQPRKGRGEADGAPYRLVMKPRVRTPEESVEIDLLEVAGQLGLYDGNEELLAIQKTLKESGTENPNGSGEPTEESPAGLEPAGGVDDRALQ